MEVSHLVMNHSRRLGQALARQAEDAVVSGHLRALGTCLSREPEPGAGRKVQPWRAALHEGQQAGQGR